MPKGHKSIFSVQAFRSRGKTLEPEQPQEARDEAHAIFKAERMAAGKAGAVVIRQDGDPRLEDCPPPVVLRVIGRVPDAFLDHLPF